MVARQQLRWPARILIALRISPAFFFVVGGLRFVQVGNVIEHEAPAFAVAKHAAFAANPFGDQNPAHADRPDHAGGMELNELHIHQFGTGLVRERVTVARVFPTVTGDLESAPDAACCQHHRFARASSMKCPFSRS